MECKMNTKILRNVHHEINSRLGQVEKKLMFCTN